MVRVAAAMDNDSLSEGLFLKNYLGTVSAVPRSRTSAHIETKPYYSQGDWSKNKIGHSLENGVLNHARIIYELGANNGNDFDVRKQQNEISERNAKNHAAALVDIIQVENDEDKDKKKEKKWTLGGLFRRKSKKDADDSSEESGEENKKGFLSRRRSKRDRRKPKVRSNANGFDVVIPQIKETSKNGEISVEQLWGSDPKPPEQCNGPVRYIHRHPDVPKANSNSLQVPKHCRRDSNLSRSSGGSENIEGRKGRKEVMARAEAKRDMMRDDSSSDEFDSYHSNSSLNRVNGDCRKQRRTDRNKRTSKGEDSQNDLRLIKSDLEGSRRLPPNCRWISRTYYPDSSDHEAVKMNLLNHSGTSSPCRSPRTRQKQLLHYMMQNAYPTSTFPPGIHHQQAMRNGTAAMSPTRNHYTKDTPAARSQGHIPNRNSEYNLPRSLSHSENANRKTLTDYEHFLNFCGGAKEKSLSYDQNIHRASYFENEPDVARTSSRRPNRGEMFMNGGRGADVYNYSPQQTVKTYNGTFENRTDSTPSLQSGNFPPQPTPIVQRSASGNSFCESSRNFHGTRYPHSPQGGCYPPKSPSDIVYGNLPPSVDSLPKSHISESPSILRYYADQNPRSRNPIHITCNPTTIEHQYLSDSQVTAKSVQSGRKSASDFWKLKDQEVIKQQRRSENSLKLPPTQSHPRSRSNSPRLRDDARAAPQTPVSFESKSADDRKTLKEEYNSAKVSKTPPEPPVRRLSKQEVLARLRKCEELKNQEDEIRRNLKSETKVHNSNLDDALNELEMIYNSLRLKDEDLAERAERRDLPVYRSKNPITSVSVRDKIQNFYAETNYSKNSESAVPNGHQRAIPLRRSGVPDKTTDDMAFRRLNQKDRTDAVKIPPQSYLRSSPALSPLPNGSPTFRRESPVLEPDVTYDDVVFRNIRHANSTLKIQDPQPPFGIPIGVVTPAPNSDYLHATPTERFRPTFTSSKTPDVVKDDLAFRNLRKDNKTNNCLEPKTELKKRAVRSLSANLYNIMQKDNPAFVPMETNNNVIFDKHCEKTQSLTDLTRGKQALEKRLKELKEENNSKRAEFFEASKEIRKKGNLSWTDLAHLNGDFEEVPEKLQKEDTSKKFRSPVVELSKYPAAVPSSSLQGNPFKEPSSLVDDDQLENLLSALAKEAENASKDLERQLDQLETKTAARSVEISEKTKERDRKIEEFNKKFKTTDKEKRRRNLSLSSNTNESKEEVRKTGSLERRRRSDNKTAFPFEEVLRGKTNETKSVREVAEMFEAAKPMGQTMERKLSKSDSASSCSERKQSQSFEMVTDLSQILHDVEVEQHLNKEATQKETSVFQEVYEYNCKLPSPERRKSRGSEEPAGAEQESAPPAEVTSDVETEFEKLHEEVTETKDTDFALVDDLIAEMTSVDQSQSESYASFPFPNEGGTSSRSGAFRHRDGASPGSSKGEETPPHDSLTDSETLDRGSPDLNKKMFPKGKEPKNVPTSNSSSESDQKRERIESYKDARRRELSAKYAPRHDPTVKSFKATRKKEDLRGGGPCGPFLRSYLNSQCPNENQVPSSESRRSSLRREPNKTDANHEETAATPRETVFVRETKASRLRAASRTPTSETGSPSPKSGSDPRRTEKDATRPPVAGSPTFNCLNRKDVDKSHSRKSHLNRSHTSEGVYDDTCVPGSSTARRRRSKNPNLESSSVKTAAEKSVPSRSAMGNANGAIKDSPSPLEQLSTGSPVIRSPLNTYRKSSVLLDKCSLKPNLGRKDPDDTSLAKALPKRPPESRHDRSKQIDIATRAEILAASTLKMINRLDEINDKSRRTQEKSLPLNSVITSENSGTHRTDLKKVPSPDDSTAKGRSRLRSDKPSPKKSPEGRKLDAKPSILKNKPPGTSSPGGDTQKPVSILKRKSLSQDDAQSCSPPVTFSPSVLKKETDTKRQGILKKRRSLDENEVMRRRSNSPDANYDFKSILKNQRRSSMEELTRRSQSPDSTPQGILKRKSSREEDNEDEPQGILKRKSLPCLNTHQHVKISETAAAGLGDVSENVRPILKKKSSSEEHSASDLSTTEVPKSILKKKTSLETEEDKEEKPKKPILKSFRVPSFEEPEACRRSRSLGGDEPRPILKRENSRSVEGGVVLRRLSSGHRPGSDIDSELSAIFLKRRSLEFQPVCAINLSLELQKTKRASSSERLRGSQLRRPLSVAEKINNLENFLEVERIERERRNSPPGTPPSDFQGAAQSRSAGALPKGRFEEAFGGAAPSPSDRNGAARERTADEQPSAFASHPSNSSVRSFDGHDLDSSSKSQAPSLRSLRSSSSSEGGQLFRRASFQSTESEQVYPVDPSRPSEDRYDTDCYYSVESCGERISSLSLKELSVGSSGEFMDAEDLFVLQRSGSVSAKASLFKEIEKKCKADAEVEKAKRTPKGNAGINRRHEKKLLESNAQRYHTQPVSTEEVELAVRKSKSNAEDHAKDEDENHEDELCKMSYKDRLRLFESTLTPKFPEQIPRKRGTRYRTQPVTTDEVETAKSQRPSTSAAAAAGQTDEASSGLAAAEQTACDRLPKARPPQEKTKPKSILKNLTGGESKKSSSDSDSSDSERRRLLKSELNESFQNLKRILRKVEKETTSELKGILKQPSLEKKGSSSSEEECPEGQTSPRGTRGGSRGANLAAILQGMEPVGGGGGGRGRKESPQEEKKTVPKYMQNSGIARVINRSRNSSLLVKSQSHSSVSAAFQPPSKCTFPEESFVPNGEAKLGRGAEADPQGKDEPDEAPLPRGGLRRSTTQPLGPSEEGSSDDMSGCSIQERLARLKKSGELDWQKRKSHVTNLEDELSVITAGNYLFNENCLLREKNQAKASKEAEELRNSSSILADRLGKLDAAKEGWKKRIKPSDAVRFSVEGKLLEKRDSLSPPNAPHQVSPTRTPLAERKKRSPKAAKFRSKQCNLSLSSVPCSPMERTDNPIARSMSAPGGGKNGLFSLSASEEVTGPVVTVPKIDDETFTSFFEGLSTERMFQERLEIKDEDLDAVTRMKSSQLLVHKRNIKTQKRRATVKNPVKALAARLDLQEYTEIKTGIAEKELKRMKIEKAARNSSLAVEALAGLASQEDFTAVSLRKAAEGGFNTPDAPYKDLMLLQVKGRRHVQTRLVEPVARNINSGDCFVLVTPNRLFHYVGEFANVIEKSRGAEIALHVQQKGDLGCAAASVVTIGEGGRASREQVEEFWGLLGGEPGCEKGTGSVDEDELFESALVDTNMVYEMVNDELVPVEAYWGSIPRIELLNPNKVLVFDYGSEFYVWNGKNVSLSRRRVALSLAKELWEEGFDYTDCELCPLTAASHVGGQVSWEEIPDSEKAGPVRPRWALFGKVTQNMETVLFREKFLDWPDYSRVIRRGKEKREEADSNGSLEVKPCDARKMLENAVPEPDLVLEGSHLGRGVRYFDEDTRRCSEVSTQDVTVWHVNEYEYSEVPPGSVGQFHMEDSYVVRWHYLITITGRELSGQPSKHLTTGRNRYAYFFWHGRDSPINDKGAAACLTVELDKEHGPQVRVVQGFEPPAFLNLFGGGMVVHRGRRCSDASRDKLRLFICRGEAESEGVLFEVPCSMRQLRSLASFLLVNKDTGLIIVWHGCKSPDRSRRIAVAAAKRFRPQVPEMGLKAKETTVREETEGSESQDFIRALGGDNRQLYYSLLQDKTEVQTPRLFHLSSVSGEFLFNEVASPHLTSPLPFLQRDLYSASQPALFLLDSGSTLWLWQGWWEDSSESVRGSGFVRFQAERRAAMTTAVAYWSLKHGAAAPKAFLIWAGLEPLVFTNQFPFWEDRDDIAEISMKDGRKPGESVPITTELASLTQSTYPLAQLQNRPLPNGVNPTTLEDYLEPRCFPGLFGMEKEEFLQLPSWKKKKLKQDAGLF